MNQELEYFEGNGLSIIGCGFFLNRKNSRLTLDSISLPLELLQSSFQRYRGNVCFYRMA